MGKWTRERAHALTTASARGEWRAAEGNTSLSHQAQPERSEMVEAFVCGARPCRWL